MSEIRFKSLFCLGYIGEGKFVHSRGGLNVYNEVVQYFYQKYKDKPGSVIFFNLTGGLVIKQLRDLTINEMKYFEII